MLSLEFARKEKGSQEGDQKTAPRWTVQGGKGTCVRVRPTVTLRNARSPCTSAACAPPVKRPGPPLSLPARRSVALSQHREPVPSFQASVTTGQAVPPRTGENLKLEDVLPQVCIGRVTPSEVNVLKLCPLKKGVHNDQGGGRASGGPEVLPFTHLPDQVAPSIRGRLPRAAASAGPAAWGRGCTPGSCSPGRFSPRFQALSISACGRGAPAIDGWDSVG